MTINWPEALRVSEKLPTRSSSLGTVVVTGNGTRSRKPSYQPEKNSLFLRMGPVSSVEKSFHWCCMALMPAALLCVKLASNLLLRTYSERVPWNSFVPPFMVILRTPPPVSPNDASEEGVETLNSWMPSTSGANFHSPVPALMEAPSRLNWLLVIAPPCMVTLPLVSQARVPENPLAPNCCWVKITPAESCVSMNTWRPLSGNSLTPLLSINWLSTERSVSMAANSAVTVTFSLIAPTSRRMSTVARSPTARLIPSRVSFLNPLASQTTV